MASIGCSGTIKSVSRCVNIPKEKPSWINLMISDLNSSVGLYESTLYVLESDSISTFCLLYTSVSKTITLPPLAAWRMVKAEFLF